MNNQNTAQKVICKVCNKDITSLADPRGHVRRCEKKQPVQQQKKEEVKVNPIAEIYKKEILVMPVEEMKYEDEYISEDECVMTVNMGPMSFTESHDQIVSDNHSEEHTETIVYQAEYNTIWDSQYQTSDSVCEVCHSEKECVTCLRQQGKFGEVCHDFRGDDNMKIVMKSETINTFVVPNEPLIDMFTEKSYGNIMVHMVTDKQSYKIDINHLSVKMPVIPVEMTSNTIVCEDGFNMVCHDRVKKYTGDYKDYTISQLPKYDDEFAKKHYEVCDFDGKMTSLNKIISDNQIQFKNADNVSYLFFDIETSTTDSSVKIPNYHDGKSFVVMIQMMVVSGDKVQKIVFLLNNNYTYRVADDVTVSLYDNQMDMCRAFFFML